MAVGKAGAKNAAIFAAQIMGRKDKGIVKSWWHTGSGQPLKSRKRPIP